MKIIKQGDLKNTRHILLWICFALLPLVVSCAAPALRNQFHNYNEAYADSLNQQMLLNLARLENGHPAYYLAIGLIDNKYTFSSQSAATASGSFTDAKTTTQNTPFIHGNPAATIASFPGAVLSTVLTSLFGFNLNETATVSSNPEFQFIPINNEIAAKQVLEPISTEVFLQLYEQGYPIDQLLRIMIERIETPRLKSGEQYVLVNSPTCGVPEYYERFLRACAILRTLQMHGFLTLEAQSKTEPLGPVSFSSGGAGSSQGSRTSGSETAPKEGGGNPTLKDFTDAENNKFVLHTNQNREWSVARKTAIPLFFLKGARETTGTNFESLPGLVVLDSAEQISQLSEEKQAALINFKKFINTAVEFLKTNETILGQKDYNPNDFEAITNVIIALSFGISIQTDVGNNDAATKLILRSFNRTMEAVASEQAGFEALEKRDAEFKNIVPNFERRPIFQMRWTDKQASLVPSLETVYYAGKTYQITDRKMDPLCHGATWNRDVFRLMVALSSQVTVDISKFQRQVLELSQ